MTYAGSFRLPTLLRSITFPSASVHPHAGASAKGVQVFCACPFSSEHSNNNTVKIVNFIAKSHHAADHKNIRQWVAPHPYYSN